MRSSCTSQHCTHACLFRSPEPANQQRSKLHCDPPPAHCDGRSCSVAVRDHIYHVHTTADKEGEFSALDQTWRAIVISMQYVCYRVILLAMLPTVLDHQKYVAPRRHPADALDANGRSAEAVHHHNQQIEVLRRHPVEHATAGRGLLGNQQPDPTNHSAARPCTCKGE